MFDIRNTLTEKSLPLSDNIDGLHKMMPPELLHTLYMFESLRDQMGGGKDRDLFPPQRKNTLRLRLRHIIMLSLRRLVERLKLKLSIV
jgi:hypothetical protein